MLYRQRRHPGNRQYAALFAAHTRRALPYRSPPPYSSPSVPSCDIETFYDSPDDEMHPLRQAADQSEPVTEPSVQTPQPIAQTYPHAEAFEKGTLFPELFSPLGKNIFGR